MALVTGGDSGIGRSIAVHYTREGASLALVYRDEHEDAKETQRMVVEAGVDCLLLSGDVGNERFCRDCVERTMRHFGRLDILVNNAAEQHPREDLEGISGEQMRQTFRTNVFAYFCMIQAAVRHLEGGGVIINTSSVVAYRGIRVNGVAPGPIWTPLIPATFGPRKVEKFGGGKPIGRAGQPAEVGPCYVFLASADASYMTGQMLHPNGGDFTTT